MNGLIPILSITQGCAGWAAVQVCAKRMGITNHIDDSPSGCGGCGCNHCGVKKGPFPNKASFLASQSILPKCTFPDRNVIRGTYKVQTLSKLPS